ncbi:MAG: hypothetical protein IJU07_06635 [Synergistaceae bacterium]|nr:hypothetical protein [Synergistaceae bacterium]
MYPVSNAYKTAMHNRVQRFKIRGSVGTFPFTDQNILAGSLSISNQCSGTENIDIGQVYIGELNATFLDLPIDRNSWYGKEINLSFGQYLGNGNYEYIPLGVFTVNEASYTASGVVVTAYDHMAKLDKTCSSLSTGAIPYNLAKSACEKCGLTLETDERTFALFPNGLTTLALYSENDINTYRDAIAWIAQACCCFVTASRSGGIVFRTYGGIEVDTIDDEHRFTGCSFSDFSTRYTGMSVINIEKQTTSYYSVTPDNGLTYNLGSNPYLQNSVSHSKTSMRRAILEKLAEIDYVPFKAECIGNPAYDLGDVLVFSDGIADATKKSVITKYSWTYGKSYVMEGVGKNPALATGHSKTDKNISGLINQTVNSDLFRCIVLRNGSAVNIGDGEKQSVIFAHYLLASPSHVRFNFEILLTVNANAPTENLTEVTINNNVLTLNPVPSQKFVTVKAIYKSDGAEITSRYPVEYWQSGKHILTLQFDLDFDDSLDHTFDLWLEVSGGSVSIAQQDAYEVISSTGLAANNNWEGTFRGEDGNLYIVIDGQAHKIPDKIKVGRFPTKSSYATDEPIDYSGLVIHAVFGDGSKSNITSACVINPKSGTPYDNQEDEYIEVLYSTWGVEYATGFDLTHNYIVNIDITPPVKLDYKNGEIIDYTGLVVKANYRDGRIVDVTNDCVITPPDGSTFFYSNQ